MATITTASPSVRTTDYVPDRIPEDVNLAEVAPWGFFAQFAGQGFEFTYDSGGPTLDIDDGHVYTYDEATKTHEINIVDPVSGIGLDANTTHYVWIDSDIDYVLEDADDPPDDESLKIGRVNTSDDTVEDELAPGRSPISQFVAADSLGTASSGGGGGGSSNTESWAWYGGNFNNIVGEFKDTLQHVGIGTVENPYNICYEPNDDDVFVVGNGKLQKHNSGGGAATAYNDDSGTASWGNDYRTVTLGHGTHDGKLFTVGHGSTNIGAFNKSDLSSNWTATLGNALLSILYTSAERLYVVNRPSSGNDEILEVDPSDGSQVGSISTGVSPATSPNLSSNSDDDVIIGPEAYDAGLSAQQWTASPSYASFSTEHHDVGANDKMFISQFTGSNRAQEPAKFVKVNALDGTIEASEPRPEYPGINGRDIIRCTPEYVVVPAYNTLAPADDAQNARLNYDLSVDWAAGEGVAITLGVESGRYSTWNHLAHW